MKANSKFKCLKTDDKGAVGMIIMGALILVLSVIIIPVFYRIAGSQNLDSLDDDIATAKGETGWPATNSTDATNATDDVLEIGGSVMSLNPLAALVAVAGGIIGILLAVLGPKTFSGAGL